MTQNIHTFAGHTLTPHPDLGGTPGVLDITTSHTKQVKISILDILSIRVYYLIGLFKDL
jgi:hypothetical protein